MGLETLWTSFSMVRWRPTVPPSAKNFARQILISCILLVATTVFFFFGTKLSLCLSLWDLGGVVFFFISNNVAIVLRFGKNRASGSGGRATFWCQPGAKTA